MPERIPVMDRKDGWDGIGMQVASHGYIMTLDDFDLECMLE
jgi:hypothetical protein